MNTIRNINALNVPLLEWKPQAEPNMYVIRADFGNFTDWLASIQFNGDPSSWQQESILNLLTTAPELLLALEKMLIAWPYMECATTIEARNAVDKAKGLAL